MTTIELTTPLFSVYLNLHCIYSIIKFSKFLNFIENRIFLCVELRRYDIKNDHDRWRNKNCLFNVFVSVSANYKYYIFIYIILLCNIYYNIPPLSLFLFSIIDIFSAKRSSKNRKFLLINKYKNHIG